MFTSGISSGTTTKNSDNNPAVRTVPDFEGLSGITNPIPVDIVNSGDDVLEYNGVTSISAAVSTDVLSYTVPVGKTLSLRSIDFSGSNIAKFDIEIGGSIKATKRTWWTKFNGMVDFDEFNVSASTVIKVKVIHNSTAVGDFEATLRGQLI